MLLKKTSHVISPILCALYKRYMNEGIFPDEIKVGKISPIYKKESEELLKKYRPVSCYIWKDL